MRSRFELASSRSVIGLYGRTVRFSTKSSALKMKTHPVEKSANVIKHLQFTGRLPFQKGLNIQEKFVRAQLDIKQLHAKIRRRLVKLYEDNVGAEVNEHETMIIDNILSMKPNPIILTFEFEPTYTGGKRIKKSITPEQITKYETFTPLKQAGNVAPKFVQVERGGQITFHGPGQMVAYIIMDLKSFQDFPAKCLVSSIETATISALKNTKIDNGEHLLNLDAKITDQTGVWVTDAEKIASIGVHVRRSICSHGVAINVCPDLSYMNNFEMCGLPDTKTTSVQEQKPAANVTVQDIAISFVNEFAKNMGVHTVERVQLDDLDIDP